MPHESQLLQVNNKPKVTLSSTSSIKAVDVITAPTNTSEKDYV